MSISLFKNLKKNHISKGSVWDSLLSSAIITPLGSLLQIVLSISVARNLSVEDFGYFNYTLQVSNLIAIILGCGLPIYTQKLIPELKAKKEMGLVAEYNGFVLIWLAGCISLVLVSTVLIGFTSGSLLIGLAITVVPTTVWLFQLYSCLSYNDIPLALGPRDILVPLVLILSLLIYEPNSGFELLVVYNVLLLVVCCTAYFTLLKKEGVSVGLFDVRPGRAVSWLKNSLPIAITSLTQFALNSLDLLLLGILGSYLDVGVYSACIKIALVVGLLNRITTIAVSHKLSALHASDQHLMLWKVYRQSIYLSAVHGVFVLLFIFWFGENILGFFGSDYANYYEVLMILSIGNFIGSLVGPVMAAHNMIGNQRYIARSQFTWLMVALIGYIIVIPFYSMFGAAIVTAVVQSLMKLSQLVSLRNIMFFNIRKNECES